MHVTEKELEEKVLTEMKLHASLHDETFNKVVHMIMLGKSVIDLGAASGIDKKYLEVVSRTMGTLADELIKASGLGGRTHEVIAAADKQLTAALDLVKQFHQTKE
jgi:hypothetical protein